VSLTASASNAEPLLDNVVNALTGVSDRRQTARPGLQAQMSRAAQEYDELAAEACGRALLEHLCRTPEDLRALEALLILGLAHPSVLKRHCVSLEAEGRRLSILLANAGEKERAESLTRTIEEHVGKNGIEPDPTAAPAQLAEGAAERIEHCLRLADEAASSGRLEDAIRLLQEVILLDRDRRDVARMIRDLRFQDQERRKRASKVGRYALAILVIAGALGLAVIRERDVARRHAAIPPAIPGNVESMRARQQALAGLISSDHVWLGLPQAWIERDQLAHDLAEIDRIAAAKERDISEAQKKDELLAKDLLERGRMYANQGRFEPALTDLRRALEVGSEHWTERHRTEAEVAAIEAWLAKQKADTRGASQR
jgi:tetratricopeptide (TPR) repeat protein